MQKTYKLKPHSFANKNLEIELLHLLESNMKILELDYTSLSLKIKKNMKNVSDGTLELMAR